MTLLKYFVLALSYIYFLAPTAVQADCICDTVHIQCNGFGTQGSCCHGYKCEGDAVFAKCAVDTNLITSQCAPAWVAFDGQTQCEPDCCPGNFCSDEGWGFQCKPNGKNADCTGTTSPSTSTPPPTSTSTPPPSITSGDAGVDYNCNKEWEACSDGSCCPGYICNQELNQPQCYLDPNSNTGEGCNQMYAPCSASGQCCEGNYCDLSEGPGNSICRSGQEGATAAPTPSSMINNAAVPFSLASITGTCPFSPNLGDGFSGATGQGHFVGPWPDVQGVPATGQAGGRDDSVAFLVGGNYFGKVGAEVEGKIVVLGDFKNNDISALVQVGLGSQIIPNNDQDVILVGGNWEMNRDVAVMQSSASVQGNIKYKGARLGNQQLPIYTNGQVDQVPNLDLSIYEIALAELRVKSAYWATLPMNGIYIPYGEGPAGNTAVFKAGNNNDCVQIFNLSHDTFANVPHGIHVEFDENLKNKTILINYSSDANKYVRIQNLANFYDPWGMSGWEFDSATTASILWNFHDATQVDLGAGTGDAGEFAGSILIPNGNLKFEMPGQSGRTIVGGNLEQNFPGSEFHNYPFEPNCQLPNFPCGQDPTPAPTNSPTSISTPALNNLPTPIPTPAPTNKPTPGPTESPTGSPINEPIVETPSPTNTPICPPGGSYGSQPGFTPLIDPSTLVIGVTQPNINPIVVGEQNCINVGFGMTNQYGTTIDYIFVQYKDPQTGMLICEAFRNVSECWFAEFTANCMRSTQVTIVTITVVHSTFSVGDAASLPDCCADNVILGDIDVTVDVRAVKYTYVFDCCSNSTACV